MNLAPRPPEPRVFHALGDLTRLSIVDRLHRHQPLSITDLTDGTDLSRQAVTKHLAVLAEAGLVRDVRRGRERLYALDAAPLRDIATWVEDYRRHWEQRFDRLEAYLATQTPPPEPNTPEKA